MILDDKTLGCAKKDWWKFFVALSLIIVFGFVLIVGSGFLVGVFVSDATINALMNGEFQPNSVLFIQLMFIGVTHLAIWLVVLIFYRRGYRSLINPLGLPIWHEVKIGAIYLFGFFIASEVIGLILDGFDVEVRFVWMSKSWLVWIIPIAIAVLLQTSAEELLFRGFFQQYMARLYAKKWFYIGLPALGWALLHLWNFEGVYLPYAVVISTFVLGLVLGDWADRRKSLIGPITIHFLNNFILMCIYGNDIEPTDMQIFQGRYSDYGDGLLAIYTLIAAVFMMLVYALLRNRYLPIVENTAEAIDADY